MNWTIENTKCKDSSNIPKKVGFGGMSYGAGIGLLLAARDSRVNSVAMLSGWYDLNEEMLPNGGVILTQASEV